MDAGGLGSSTEERRVKTALGLDQGNDARAGPDRPSVISQILIFLSKPPLATHPASRLGRGISRRLAAEVPENLLTRLRGT